MLHADYSPTPFWWEDAKPEATSKAAPAARYDVIIVGAGYAGTSAAIEFALNGASVAVFEADNIGSGASTKSGGQVSGGMNIGKSFSGARAANDPARQRQMQTLMRSAADGMTFAEELINRIGNPCEYERVGRLTCAFVPKHFDGFKKRSAQLNEFCDAEADLVPREEMRSEIGTDYYFGGMRLKRAGLLQPAKFFHGLVAEARRNGVEFFGNCPVKKISGKRGKLSVAHKQGVSVANEVVVCTNGYTGPATPELQSRVIPIASHIIATEELPSDLAREISPNKRGLGDTQRVLNYFRLSPDGRRMIFGGRPRFTKIDQKQTARLLYEAMVDRFPALRDFKVTHCWSGNVGFTYDYLPHIGEKNGTHFVLGCNGNGVTTMPYLGYLAARHIIEGKPITGHPFGETKLPWVPLYSGKPWFLPMVGNWYRFLDSVDRSRAS